MPLQSGGGYPLGGLNGGGFNLPLMRADGANGQFVQQQQQQPQMQQQFAGNNIGPQQRAILDQWAVDDANRSGAGRALQAPAVAFNNGAGVVNGQQQPSGSVQSTSNVVAGGQFVGGAQQQPIMG